MSLEQVWLFMNYEMDKKHLIENKLRKLEQQDEITESDSEDDKPYSKVAYKLTQSILYGRSDN